MPRISSHLGASAGLTDGVRATVINNAEAVDSASVRLDDERPVRHDAGMGQQLRVRVKRKARRRYWKRVKARKHQAATAPRPKPSERAAPPESAPTEALPPAADTPPAIGTAE